jgi:hypothetical protein
MSARPFGRGPERFTWLKVWAETFHYYLMISHRADESTNRSDPLGCHVAEGCSLASMAGQR